MLKVRTLFSGIGSPESALKNLQIPYELIDFCEVDKYAVKSYCAVHGVSKDKNLGDITKVWGRNLPYADLLVWGFPCQDISVAGKQRGLKEGETRSGLYYEGFRILKETKPKYSIIENVKNLVGKRFKADFESMLEDIESLGYNNYWKILNAKDYGIPQNGERVFIVSIRKDIDDGNFQFPLGFDNGMRLKDFLEDEVDEKFYVSNKMVEGFIKHNINHRAKGTGFIWEPTNVNGYAKTLRANAALCPTDNTIKVLVREATKKGYAEALVGDSINIQFPNSKTRRGRVGREIAQTLETACNQATLTQDYRIRKLTPKECWRLMGFTDEEFKRAEKVNSNSQLYKQAGNSIVTNVLAAIFKKLLQAEITQIYEENKELS